MNTVTFQPTSGVPNQDDVTWNSTQIPAKPWENPGYLLDRATSHTLETAINAGCLPIIVCIGIVGNVINIFVFAKQGLQDRINVCLFCLALADCGYLFALIIPKSFSLLALFSVTLGNFWKVRSLNTILGVFWGFSTVSNLLTLLVSVERCLCVVNPLKAKQLLRTRVMVVIIVLIYVLILSTSTIINVKFKVGTITDKDANLTIYIPVLTDFYLHNKLFVDIIYNYLMAIALPFTSLLVVVISTITTVIVLKRALSWKAKSANLVDTMDKKETAVTKMLLLVCYAYVIFVTPSVVSAFVVQFVDGWNPAGRYANSFYVYVALMHLLTGLNSSINFFIYYSRSSKFQSTFRQFCCKGQKQDTN